MFTRLLDFKILNTYVISDKNAFLCLEVLCLIRSEFRLFIIKDIEMYC
jgi:hypothetical protein